MHEAENRDVDKAEMQCKQVGLFSFLFRLEGPYSLFPVADAVLSGAVASSGFEAISTIDWT